MTSKELEEELRKQVEKEKFEEMAKEYLRIKKLVAESGMLSHDEAVAITMEVCRNREVFNLHRGW